MIYNSNNITSEIMYASSMLHMLRESGFTEELESVKAGERIFSLAAADNLRIIVYTAISFDCGVDRGRGWWPVRVCLVRKCVDGQERDLGQTTRVKRVGDINEIVSQVRDRIQSTLSTVSHLDCCKTCGVPLFMNFYGSLVCSDLCWRNDVDKEIVDEYEVDVEVK